MRSFPVIHHGQSVGSLNLYSKAPGGYPTPSTPEGAVRAPQIALALETSNLLDEATSFIGTVQEEAQRRSTVVEATDVLMAVRECTVEQAHRLMENASSAERTTIIEVAR